MKRLSFITLVALLAAPALPAAPELPGRADFAESGSALIHFDDGRVLEDDDRVVEVDIMQLTQVDWDPGRKLPKEIAGLDGRKVKITGFMALDTPEGTSSFRLTYDQCGCSNAKASHFVEVDMGDETVGYNPDEVSLTGTFSVGEKREDGFVISLFRMKAESIE